MNSTQIKHSDSYGITEGIVETKQFTRTSTGQRSLTWIATQAERFSPWIVAAILGEIVSIAFLTARYRLLWLDEIIGLLTAKLPSISDIWAACQSGTDNLPP